MSLRQVVISLGYFGSIPFFVSYVFFLSERNGYISKEKLKVFKAFTAPVQNLGKWLCMDVNNIDQDGYPDIILGNFSIGGFNQPGVQSTWNTKLPFIVLKNQFNKQSKYLLLK